MTVAEFIDWLKTQPQDALVEVIRVDAPNEMRTWETFRPALAHLVPTEDGATVLELGT